MKKRIIYTLLIISGVIVFFPIIYSLIASFMTTKDIMSGKLLPSKIDFINYRELLQNIPILQFFLNSLITSIVTMIFQVIICSLTAYALVFVEFKEKKLVFLLVMGSIFIPWEAIFIPNYFIILKMKLLNTKIGIILPFLANGLGIFLMVQQFKTLNKSLIEASKIDGCSHIFIYLKIVLPL
ncbi:MAG: carbohydrate ABC transporter permease, partial [Cetobacterium sp.]